jgi:hypothetical protein
MPVDTMSPASGRSVTEGSTIFEQAVCLLLEFRRLGTRRKVALGEVTRAADLDARLVHVSKDLLDAKELQAIDSHDGETRRFILNRCTPSGLKLGIYVLPLTLFEDCDRYLIVRDKDRARLVEAFVDVYETRKREAMLRLGTLAVESEYPSVAAVRAAFGVRWQYLMFGTPDTLKGISREVWDREAAKAGAQWADALEEGKQILRATFADLVDQLAERLLPADGGKSKRFADSTVEKFEEFCDLFAKRNLAQDTELADLVNRARGVMAGVAPDDLRKQKDLRRTVAARMVEVAAVLDTLVIDRPTRRYSDDEV